MISQIRDGMTISTRAETTGWCSSTFARAITVDSARAETLDKGAMTTVPMEAGMLC